MPVRVPLEFVKPTMRLATPITDAAGKLLVGKGTALDDRVVRALRKLAIQAVVVDDSAEIRPWETVRTLQEESAALAERFRCCPATAETTALRDAIARHLERRWARLQRETPAAEADPETAAP